MATKTLGTNLTTTLTALQYQPGMSDADLATINALVKDDQNATNQFQNAFRRDGLLYVPNRGFLRLYPNDWIGVDGAGWLVLVSNAIIGTSWSHN